MMSREPLLLGIGFGVLTLLVLLGVMAVRSTDKLGNSEKPIWQMTDSERKAAHINDIRMYPFQIGGSFYCDSPPYREWHYCYQPEIIGQEHNRIAAVSSGMCQSDNNAAIVNTLKRMNISCNSEMLQGYDQAVEDKYSILLESMRLKQGVSLVEMESNIKNSCMNKKQTQLSDTGQIHPILYEIAVRRCAQNFLRQLN